MNDRDEPRDIAYEAAWTAPVSEPSPKKLLLLRVLAAILFPLYLLVTARSIGLRTEHLAIALVFLTMFFIGPRTARFAVLALPFLGVGILYDNMRLVLGLRGEIHVGDLYAMELRWFSVNGPNGPMILPEFFRARPWVGFDLVCGFAYLAYLAESFLYAVFLFFRDPSRVARFAWAFFFVNLLGMITYLVYPAAPPWYVEQYGLGPVVLDAKPSAAGALRFDELTGIPYFQAFYSRNANVFGAMPSLHVAYPTVVFCSTWKMGPRFSIPALSFALLVAFSAVYLRHHYVLDLVVGVLYGGVSYGLISWVESWRTRPLVPAAVRGEEGARS